MKFKVGDKVKILDKSDQDWWICEDMDCYIGHEYEITRVDSLDQDDIPYQLANTYWYNEDALKLVEAKVTEDMFKRQEPEEYNVVSKPKHYMLLEDKGVEVRHLMKALADRLEQKYSAMFISDYIQAMQYLLRFDQKNAKEDLEKAQWYIQQLISNYKEKESKQ